MKPPYDRITRIVGTVNEEEGAVWDAFDSSGEFLLTLGRYGMEAVVNHPERQQAVTLQLHDDPDGEKLIVLGPETTLDITWD